MVRKVQGAITNDTQIKEVCLFVTWGLLRQTASKGAWNVICHSAGATPPSSFATQDVPI